MPDRATARRRACAALLLLAPLAACRAEEGGQAEAPDPADVGRCALEVRSRSLIGTVVGVGTDPATGEPAYLVRLETSPGDTAYVGAGAPIVDCATVRGELLEENPEPVRSAADDTAR